jgi:DtxR family Mn-dependent transcriptional regulator
MEQLLSVSIQDYLKHIYELTETGGSASTNALAKKLKISAPSVNGMIRKMGHPVRDPHGELIPTAELKMPLERSTPLSALRPNQTAKIRSVRSGDPELLRFLASQGLGPDAQIEILAHSQFDHNLTIKAGLNTNVLGLSITSKIFVEPYK